MGPHWPRPFGSGIRYRERGFLEKTALLRSPDCCPRFQFWRLVSEPVAANGGGRRQRHDTMAIHQSFSDMAAPFNRQTSLESNRWQVVKNTYDTLPFLCNVAIGWSEGIAIL